MNKMTKRKLAAVFFPERCPYCRAVVKPLEPACEECISKLPEKSYEKILLNLTKVVSSVPYKELYADAIKRVKFGGKKQYAHQLAMLMKSSFDKEYSGISFDTITFVPLHKDTLKERGFNQSELLAKELALNTGIGYSTLLKKTRKNKPQHNLPKIEREKNVSGVYRCIDKKEVKGKNILIIDDIVTTGFTLSECAKTLKSAGANEIYALTFAISLPKTT